MYLKKKCEIIGLLLLGVGMVKMYVLCLLLWLCGYVLKVDGLGWVCFICVCVLIGIISCLIFVLIYSGGFVSVLVFNLSIWVMVGLVLCVFSVLECGGMSDYFLFCVVNDMMFDW